MHYDAAKIFNNDIKDIGSYAYTNKSFYSAYIATKKQSEEILKTIKLWVDPPLKILDVGCGDGTFTLEIFDTLEPRIIVGFDTADQAIAKAKEKISLKKEKRIFFNVSSIYDIEKNFEKRSFNVAILRGVLHHLDDSQRAIKALSQVVDKVIVLEPNGYNPILKIIEKSSKYHVRHKEQSYWPPKLNNWFIESNYKLKQQKFFGLVPYFCSPIIAKMLKIVEPLFENIPFLNRFYCGTNLIYFEK